MREFVSVQMDKEVVDEIRRLAPYSKIKDFDTLEDFLAFTFGIYKEYILYGACFCDEDVVEVYGEGGIADESSRFRRCYGDSRPFDRD